MKRTPTHGHGHAHATEASRAFAIGVGLNLVFVLVEVVAGVAARSVALLSDAAHNFGDVIGLLLAWGALRLAQRKPSARRTYGLRRSTILASLANALLLMVVVGGVSWEAIERFRTPSAPAFKTMLLVAGIGVVINAGTALLFARGHKHDANVRGAFLHLAADAAVSLGVVIAGGVIMVTGYAWVDPLVSLVVSVVILASTWALLRDAMNLALDAVPAGIDPEKVRAYLSQLPRVRELHDLHIWPMSTTETALTAHLVVDGPCEPSFLASVSETLEHDFHIHHATLQLEPADTTAECARAADCTP
jgi:cobalt-zinc-cadmium efflux system protein